MGVDREGRAARLLIVEADLGLDEVRVVGVAEFAAGGGGEGIGRDQGRDEQAREDALAAGVVRREAIYAGRARRFGAALVTSRGC